MTATGTKQARREDLVAAAEGFADEIARRAGEIEANRFLPQDLSLIHT